MRRKNYDVLKYLSWSSSLGLSLWAGAILWQGDRSGASPTCPIVDKRPEPRSTKRRAPDRKPGDPELAKVLTLLSKRDTEALIQIATAYGKPAAGPEEARHRTAAVHAIGNIGDLRGLEFLRGLVVNGQRELVVRLAAISALARAGRPEDLDFLQARLDLEPSNIVQTKIQTVLETAKK